MRKINAVIFDLDGTLVYFKIDYMSARQDVIQKLYEIGIPQDLISINQRIMDVLKITENYLKFVCKTPEKIPIIKKQIENIISKYEMDGAKRTNLTPGANELLTILKKENYKLGLFTIENREITNYILKKFSIDPYFESIVTRDDVENLKPHPEHLEMVLKQLNVTSNEIIVIGDNPVDLECAKQLNAIAIARMSEFHTKNELFKAGADYIIENLLEINKILKEHIQ